MFENRNKQKNRSELLRQQHRLNEEKRAERISQKAAEVQKSYSSVNRGFNAIKLKHQRKDQGEQKKMATNRMANLTPQIKEKKTIRLHLSWRILSALLVILLGMGIITAWRSPQYQVAEIEINGLERISKEEVSSVVNILGQPVIKIRPEELIESLNLSYPEFKDVKVSVTFPGHVTISVTERQPAFAWQLKDRILWVDADGFVFPARGQSSEMLTIQSDSLPGFYYSEPEVTLDGEKYHPIRNYWKLPINDTIWYQYHRQIDPNLHSAITRLNAQLPSEKILIFDKSKGLGWNDARGWKVFVGLDLERIDEKLVMVEKIVNELSKQGITPTLISAEYLHAPYYRLD